MYCVRHFAVDLWIYGLNNILKCYLQKGTKKQKLERMNNDDSSLDYVTI